MSLVMLMKLKKTKELLKVSMILGEKWFMVIRMKIRTTDFVDIYINM